MNNPPPSSNQQSLELTETEKGPAASNATTPTTTPSMSPPPTNLNITIDTAMERIGMGTFQYRILVAAGLCFAADSMEVLLLSFLSVVLQAQWQLTEHQAAFLTSSVFVGALTGTLVLGRLGDRVGRQPVFWFTAALICAFGFGTALAHNFVTLVVFRFGVGFGVGGLTVPFDTLAEFVPDSHRGRNLLLIEYFWTLGTLLVPVAAIATLGQSDQNDVGNDNNNEWRWFVVLCGIPCLISCIVAVWYVPESPRWLLTQGKPKQALEILRQAAACNGHDAHAMFPHDMVLQQDEEEESDNVCDLLKPEWRWTTIFLWITWAGFAFVYYGTILAVTLVFASGEDMEAEGLYSFDYGAILASASSEIAGTTLVLVLVDRVGRIPTQVGSYIGGGCCLLVLSLLATREDVGDGVTVTSSRGLSIAMAFLSRMFYMGGSCTTWVSTAEVLPTEIRSTGHSSANAVARLSGSVVPFLVTSNRSFQVVGGVIWLISMITAAASSRIPETMGQSLGHAKTTHVTTPRPSFLPKPDDKEADESRYQIL